MEQPRSKLSGELDRLEARLSPPGRHPGSLSWKDALPLIRKLRVAETALKWYAENYHGQDNRWTCEKAREALRILNETAE